MVGARIYVEGGGGSKALRTECRRGFSEFFRRAGLEGKMPRVVATGSRRAAYDDLCTALKRRSAARVLLLVDSEGPVAAGDGPWAHLRKRVQDQWSRPESAVDDDCHLMVQVMETWFLADESALAKFFGQGFNAGRLPKRRDIEEIPKTDVFTGLEEATRSAKTKGRYRKGAHSFKILALIDPRRVRDRASWAERLLATLAE